MGNEWEKKLRNDQKWKTLIRNGSKSATEYLMNRYIDEKTFDGLIKDFKKSKSTIVNYIKNHNYLVDDSLKAAYIRTGKANQGASKIKAVYKKGSPFAFLGMFSDRKAVYYTEVLNEAIKHNTGNLTGNDIVKAANSMGLNILDHRGKTIKVGGKGGEEIRN